MAHLSHYLRPVMVKPDEQPARMPHATAARLCDELNDASNTESSDRVYVAVRHPAGLWCVCAEDGEGNPIEGGYLAVEDWI